jgi:2-dehydropantoate 2-reductase
MKIAIYGAGAIGGYLGCELSRTGAADVTMIARGRTLAAIRENGLRLLIDGEERTARPAVTDDPGAAGPQDYVIVAVKANASAAIVDGLLPLLGPETAVVTAQNGVPWWYFHRLGGPNEGRTLEAVDPGGVQWKKIGPERAIGCVVYPATEAVAPGVIRHQSMNRFVVGEPSGEKTERVERLSEALKAAGFTAPIRTDIRDEIWVKLWGNLSFNPISALTGGTLEQLAFDPAIREVVRRMMVEAQAIGEALGVSFKVGVDRRIDGAGKVGAHRTSMLQDLDAGRTLEIDALVTAVQELGRLTERPCPTVDTVLALVQQKARLAGCY